MSPEDRTELHAKLDALLDANFTSLAALVSQLHYQAFFRQLLPEGYQEKRIQAQVEAELPRLLDPAMTDAEFDEATLGDDSLQMVVETLVQVALEGDTEAYRVFFERLRTELEQASTTSVRVRSLESPASPSAD
jgi:hypothetical protein